MNARTRWMHKKRHDIIWKGLEYVRDELDAAYDELNETINPNVLWSMERASLKHKYDLNTTPIYHFPPQQKKRNGTVTL
jgi:hypothetical protein